ncbi:cysteine desulfurase family protein [Azospirillum halopraeferens]|uniref:cysteine desulfurase family protein n=1 Tax=Azospirillum halopraeferens TaxID=34010 RepID=UPI00042063D2|nr:cysteine desulfurase family protein [Azospirillum halopraeferens]
MIHLDHNATTPIAPEALAAMLPHLADGFANPSSPYGAGMAAREAVGTARAAVAALVGAKPGEVVFTSGATEANHLAILGALHAVARTQPARRHLVTAAVEHPATLLLAGDLAGRGWRVTVLPVGPDGRVAVADLEAAVDDATALVSLQWANNETGVLQPVAEAAAIAGTRGALFHSDAVQAAGRVPVDLAAVPADLLTLSAHKMHGPKGAGALVVRKGTPLAVQIHGHQERRRRGGTENVAAIAGFGVAAELAARALAAGAPAATAALRDRLEAGLLAACPGAAVNGAGAPRLPNTTNIRFADPHGRPADAEELLLRLDRAGIQVSMGAACASGGNEPSHVLTAMGLDAREAAASLRFSLGRTTTAAEVAAVLDALPPLCARAAAFGT